MKSSHIFKISQNLVLLMLIVCLAGFSVPAFAQTDGIGSVTDLKGTAFADRDGQTGLPLEKGQDVFSGDRIETGADSSIIITLADNTTFTLGPVSQIVLDEFIYDEQKGAGKVSTELVKGVFRFMTGKIAHENPENMQVKLPNGYIGVRGTTVLVDLQQLKALIVLLHTVTHSRRYTGKIAVGNQVNGKTVETLIDQANFGSEIGGPNQAPTGPFKVDRALIESLLAVMLSEAGDDRQGLEAVDFLKKLLKTGKPPVDTRDTQYDEATTTPGDSYDIPDTSPSMGGGYGAGQ